MDIGKSYNMSVYFQKGMDTYFLSRANAMTPAASGAEADVPLNSSVHL